MRDRREPVALHVKFSSPPQQRKRQKPKNASGLDTISERPPPAHAVVAVDASTSTTDLAGVGAAEGAEDPASPRKVQKGQINALAKMLSALRR